MSADRAVYCTQSFSLGSEWKCLFFYNRDRQGHGQLLCIIEGCFPLYVCRFMVVVPCGPCDHGVSGGNPLYCSPLVECVRWCMSL